MNFRKILNLRNSNESKETRDTYSLDFTGPCGKRIDRCKPYMEHVSSQTPKKDRTACETCGENSQLD